ncbi:MAG: hypothetical protein WAM79_13445 [Candidatus Sulfotelmatobacter sp.]
MAGQTNAQQPAQAPSSQQPQVRVNMLNVCMPSAEEQKEIASALARVPREPLFGTDFEVSRGRSTLTEMPSFVPVGERAHVSDDAPAASYVRMRREFSVQALFSSVQYSFSDDGQTMVETLVFHVRDPKDLIEVSLEDSASSVTNAASMVAADTPASRVRLERFGKSSIALARCSAPPNGPAPDQSAYEPLFQSASSVLTNYRGLLHVKAIVPEELAKISQTRSKPRAAAKAKPRSQKK